jgi:hypothetical protein
MIGQMWRWIVREMLLYEGSTRGVGLMRILLVGVVWTKYASKLMPFRVFHDPLELTMSMTFYVASTMMFVGLWSRLSTGVTGALLMAYYYYQGLQLDDDFFIHHHTYLLNIGVLFLAFTDCGKSFSVDRWLALRRARAAGDPPPAEQGVLWGLRLIAFQVTMVYWWGAWDKTHLAFGERMEHYHMNLFFGSDYPPFAGFTLLMALMGTVTVAIEYALPLALTWPPTRTVSVWIGIVLHILFYLVLPVSTFSATMLLFYIAFLNQESVHRVVDEMMGIDGNKATSVSRD